MKRNTKTPIEEFKYALDLWFKAGFEWRLNGRHLYLKDCTENVPTKLMIAIDTVDFGFACYDDDTNEAYMINEKEHKLVDRTIRALKKLYKEVENVN